MIRRRHITDRGLRFIGRFEGFRADAYKPVAAEQYWTIGYGHYGPDVRPTDTITKAAALKLLRKDAKVAEKAVRRNVRVRLNQEQFDALVSFVFNVGAGAFANSTLLAWLNQGNYASVPSQLMRWVNGASGPLAGLVARREAEGRLFSRGQYH